MSAVATKPRKSAPKSSDGSARAVYKRPEQVYSPAKGETADERLATLCATLRAADEKIEAAYDATERGTVVDTLLHLIAHTLMCTALHPVLRGEDEPAIPVTRVDLAETYEALFPVLAALEGAMALSIGTVISSTLADAYSLLDWAQTECDFCALGKLLPDHDPAPAFLRGRDLAIEMLKEGQRQYAEESANAQRIYRVTNAGEVAPAQNDFVREYLYKLDEDSTLLYGFSAVLSAALSEQPTDDPESYRVPKAEFEAGVPGCDGTEAMVDSELPDPVESDSTAKPMPKWRNLDMLQGDINNARTLLNLLSESAVVCYRDPDACEQAQSRVVLLSAAVEGYLHTAYTELGETVAQLREQPL